MEWWLLGAEAQEKWGANFQLEAEQDWEPNVQHNGYR